MRLMSLCSGITVLLTILGCAGLVRGVECNQLGSAVQESGHRLRTLSSKQPDAPTLREGASELRRMAAKIDALSLDDRTLAERSRRLSSMNREMAGIMEEFASMMDNANSGLLGAIGAGIQLVAGAESYQRRIESLQTEYQAIGEEIDAYCSP